MEERTIMSKSQATNIEANASAENSGSPIVSSGVVEATAVGKPAANASVQKALEAVMAENAVLRQQVSANSSQAAIDQMAAAFTKAISSIKPETPSVDTNNRVNSTTSLTNKLDAGKVDGRGLMEAQETLLSFKSEPKMPISIPRSLSNSIGPFLAITVNGVRVAIPCDGVTYYINRTHYEHAKERVAKLDLLSADSNPDIKITLG
jgi:hypothetical protein